MWTISLALLLAIAMAEKYKAVDLSSVGVLTFQAGRETTGRRTSPIPQLKCQGNACSDGDAPRTIVCNNQGTDDRGGVIWKCQAEMDSEILLGDIDVNCEGYNRPGDDLVLAGSCSLSYSLNYRSNSRRQQRHSSNPNFDSRRTQRHSSSEGGSSSGLTLFVLIAVVLFVSCCCGSRRRSDPSGRAGGAYGGGGPNVQTGQPYYPSDCAPGTQTTEGWRPGFMTGMGTGGLMGYMFGRRNARNNANSGYGLGHAQPTYTEQQPQSTIRTATAYGGTSTRGQGGFFRGETSERHGANPTMGNTSSR